MLLLWRRQQRRRRRQLFRLAALEMVLEFGLEFAPVDSEKKKTSDSRESVKARSTS